jgi:hypothetical protein
MLIIDTNLLSAVTKYDSAGRLRPGRTRQPATPRDSGWHFLLNEIIPSLRRLSPFKTDKLFLEELRKVSIRE